MKTGVTLKVETVRARPGFHVTNREAAIIYDAAEVKQHKTKEQLLEYATPEDSPAHGIVFHVTPSEAQHRYYLERCRYLLNSYEIVFVNPVDNTVVVVPGVEFVTEPGLHGTSLPVTAHEMVSDRDSLEAVTGQAIRDLRAFRDKYARLLSLDRRMRSIFAAINRFLDDPPPKA